MGIYNQARRWAVAVVCTAGAVAGLSVAAPGAASAACITGSGSSLQAEQQSLWTTLFSPVCGTVEYTATSSGKGLTEFGIQGAGVLTPTESGNKTKLDAFVGTDDAPTLTELAQTEAGAKKADTVAWTAPIVSAPIAVILHPPTGCNIAPGTSAVFGITLEDLELIFLKGLTWKEFLGLFLKLSLTESPAGSCNVSITIEVRSDSSGTSFAFKQFLCQIDPSDWGKVTTSEECESGAEYVVDGVLWPVAVETEHVEGGKTVPNEGSKGEANAVKETPGSIGYVNLANAVAVGVKPFGTGASQSTTLFWAQIEGATATEFAEPVKNTTEGNCPTSYSFPTGVETEAKEGMWAKVHLALIKQAGAYSICTFTYDIGWQNYETAELEKEFGVGKGKTIGEGTKEYFEYMTKTGAGNGQGKIKEYYSPLPTGAKSVRAIAEEIAVNHIG